MHGGDANQSSDENVLLSVGSSCMVQPTKSAVNYQEWLILDHNVKFLLQEGL
jgi:NAD-dependent SIR2 family protein deacetylase